MPLSDSVVLRLPFMDRWAVQMSPARRVPSHGVDLFGQRFAIDFVGVDEGHRTAPVRDWRTFLATEPPERFFGYGRPILAPIDGSVVAVHDGEIDHEARRSQLTLIPYALGQASRLRQGVTAVTGNYVTIANRTGDVFVMLAHLRAKSLRVALGDDVSTGELVAECGNSGNSTQPHMHVQIMDSPDFSVARGIPIAFRGYREWPRGANEFHDVESGIPGESAVVEPLIGE